jgi:hypothetical protein
MPTALPNADARCSVACSRTSANADRQLCVNRQVSAVATHRLDRPTEDIVRTIVRRANHTFDNDAPRQGLGLWVRPSRLTVRCESAVVVHLRLQRLELAVTAGPRRVGDDDEIDRPAIARERHEVDLLCVEQDVG